jgi:FkbM family methyltransferase
VALAYARVLGQPELRVADFDGYKGYVNLAEHAGICSFFFRQDLTAWPTPSLVGEGDVCVDAGANAGVYTLLLASVVGSRGRVVAFEPNPFYSSLVERSVGLNGWQARARVDRRALWERGGERLRFFLSTNSANSGTSSLINHGVYLDESRTIEVDTVTLDEYVREHAIERMAVVKIDVERAENHVLAGMRGVLDARRINYLIIEMLAHSDAQHALAEHGYECFLIDEAHRQLVPVGQVPRDHFGDYIAVSPDLRATFMRRFGAAVR